MSIHDGLKYKKALKTVQELELLLLDIDKASEYLYDNIQYPEIWDLIIQLEEVRVKYFVEYHENCLIAESKGKIDE